MKNSEIRSMSIEELHERLTAEKESITKYKFAHAISPLEDSSVMSKTKKTIARIATEIRAREIQNN